MTKLRLNHTLLFALITAFLTMQWTTTHIHLAEHHDHDNSHHQHDIEVHTHQSIDHHADVVEPSHQTNDIDVVELGFDFNAQKVEKLEKPSTTFLVLTLPQISFISHYDAKLPDLINTKLNYLNRSTVNPRSPPAHS